ncbi:MAG: class I SAM-dependent methyltransferase, partial [Desulfobulbaceae bacterium]|nr:class I SAM-dependent methyltransferase [Desulfobulbaceae bacterium]
APQTDTLFENDLKKCLAKDGIRRDPLAPNAVKILKKKAAFKDALNFLNTEKENGLAEKIQTGQLDILHNQLLLLLLKNVIITDFTLEQLLTEIRRCILGLAIGKQLEDHDDSLYEFVCALALQCWSNEYVYVESDAEPKWIAQLKSDIEQSLASSDNQPLFHIALFGSYRPLHQLSGARKLISCSDFQIPCLKELIVRQIQEPFEEQNIRDEIQEICVIQDKISKSVRSQYEENPYPRWNDIAQTGEPCPLVLKLRRLFPHYEPGAFSVSSSPKILVAGCGTGQEVIQSSLTFSGAGILAVDLSRASLSYAIRKARHLNISNIEFRHGDILGLAKLDSQFDVIQCSGVLHHMQNPIKGWRILVDLLKPGGFMCIGLYSEIARKSIIAAKKFIAEHGYKPTIEGIRQCRQDVSQLPENHPAHKVTLVKDFYSTSECRDLLFHVQEHRFTIPQLEQAFGELGLEFLGFFQDDPRVIKNYRGRFPKDLSANSLENWSRFEIENPDIFIGMYKFWVRKIKI